ncbi:hypothetical protein LZU85_10780 [Vibrio sp. IRLE0018]|uniref:hypothetical protein n=1 Tax=Vibrio floridensis TaxID=2908007 RepID=UPI001F479B4B|nr:hypothetical protein [Vibrio floridensis]MCF8779284.1 hypothetical protein [Vibrio floridensis]
MNNFAIEILLIALLMIFVALIVTQVWLWLRPFIYDVTLPIELKHQVRSLMNELDQVKPQGAIAMKYAEQFELISLRKTAMPEKLQLVKSLFDEVKMTPGVFDNLHERATIERCVNQYQALMSSAPLSSRALCYSNTGYFLSACGVWLCQVLLAK